VKPRAQTTAIQYTLLVTLAIIVLVPFLGIILASLHPADSQVGGISLPSRLSWENFAVAWNQANFGNLVRSSVLIAVCVVPLAIILATLGAYGLEVLKAPGARFLAPAFVFGLTIPVELVVVALYFNLQDLGLSNSYIGVILAEVALFMPFGIYWMQAHFSTVPHELVEAGRIDGANDHRILLRVLLPISWPAITTLAVLYFMWSWNQFLLVLVLMQDPNKRTAPAGLGYFVGQYSTNIPLLSAASIIVIAPIVIVYLIFQRNFVAGVTQGAIK
jgi:ABC-type glycerol-3-phosphate transport system permease component